MIPPGGTTPHPTDAAPASRSSSVVVSVVLGTLGFTFVSTVAFGVWAFGGSWFRWPGGEPTMYAVIALVFAGLTSFVLSPLIHGERRPGRFARVFVPAFLAYAALWSACWFALGSGLGEWLGALAGSAAFVGLAARFLKTKAPAAVALGIAVFFAAHTAGYFAGGQAMAHFMKAARQEPQRSPARARWATVAKLSWGVCYGLGFGAGMGFAFHRLQRDPRATAPAPTLSSVHPDRGHAPT